LPEQIKPMTPRQISLEGVPEPIARAIELMVQSARELAGQRAANRKVELPVWNLGIKQPLQREDYYDVDR
jgi:hypothetical protein